MHGAFDPVICVYTYANYCVNQFIVMFRQFDRPLWSITVWISVAPVLAIACHVHTENSLAEVPEEETALYTERCVVRMGTNRVYMIAKKRNNVGDETFDLVGIMYDVYHEKNIKINEQYIIRDASSKSVKKTICYSDGESAIHGIIVHDVLGGGTIATLFNIETGGKASRIKLRKVAIPQIDMAITGSGYVDSLGVLQVPVQTSKDQGPTVAIISPYMKVDTQKIIEDDRLSQLHWTYNHLALSGLHDGQLIYAFTSFAGLMKRNHDYSDDHWYDLSDELFVYNNSIAEKPIRVHYNDNGSITGVYLYVDGSSIVHLVWKVATNGELFGPERIMHIQSFDQGSTWTKPEVVTKATKGHARDIIFLEDSNNNIYLSYSTVDNTSSEEVDMYMYMREGNSWIMLDFSENLAMMDVSTVMLNNHLVVFSNIIDKNSETGYRFICMSINLANDEKNLSSCTEPSIRDGRTESHCLTSINESPSTRQTCTEAGIQQ